MKLGILALGVTTWMPCASWGSQAPAPTATPAATVEPVKTDGIVPVLVISGSVVEERDPMAAFSGDHAVMLRDLTEQIDSAKVDPQAKGLGIVLAAPDMGLAQATDLREHLEAFRASGKELIVLIDEAGLADYYVASAADKVVLSPGGSLEIYGIAMHFYFFKDLLGKLGVEAQAIHTGPYKDAFEPLTASEMSDATREQMMRIRDDLEKEFVGAVGRGRGLSPEKTREALWSGPYFSEAALKAGLVTDIAYSDDYLDEWAQGKNAEIEWEYEPRHTPVAAPKPDGAPPASLFSLLDQLSAGGPRDTSASDSSPRIVVVTLVGPITEGTRSSSPFAREQVIASDDFVDMMEGIRDAGPISALVLRINSPGGSALASDLIWHYLESVREEDEFPIIASFGDVAASGGYYIAMGADRIVAEPTTLTGSIGVIGGRLAFGGTYEKIGVRQQMISVGANAGMLDDTRLWDDRETKVLQSMIDGVYGQFTSKAAEGRKMPVEKLRELAGGRVWSGAAAKEVGLVDELGGLDHAIEVARQLSNQPGAKVQYYPREESFFELLQNFVSTNMETRAGIHRVAAARPTAVPALPAVIQALPAGIPKRQAIALWQSLSLIGERPKALAYRPIFFDVR